MKTALCALCIALVGCSPYAKDLAAIEQDYRGGRLSAAEYWNARAQLLHADQAWRANFAQAMQNANAGVQQSIQHQQAINAYNARTQVYQQPQTVNVNVRRSYY